MKMERKPDPYNYIQHFDRVKTRSLLFIISIAVCIWFALRPIPGVFEPNDTGRYVDYFISYCAGSGNDVFIYSATSMHAFYAVLSPTCFVGERAFLFSAAIVVPTALLVVSRLWRGAVYWFLAYIFSVYSIELMTNALRQGLATAMLFTGMALWRRPFVALPIIVGSAVAHSSISLILPFAILWSLLRYGKHKEWISAAPTWTVTKWQMGGLSIIIAGFGLFAITASDHMAESTLFYRSIYAHGSNVQFIIFMNLPIIAIFLIRRNFDDVKFTSDEGLLFLYAVAVVVVGLIFVPAIVYRFSMLFVPMQFFLILQSQRASSRSGIIALMFFAAHMAFFAISSDSFVIGKLLWS